MSKEATILVTGASGMIGSCIVKKCLEKGYSVVGIDLKASIAVDNIQYNHEIIDLSNLIALKKVFTDRHITHVIHLAALAHTVGEADLSWEKYYQINVANTCNIAYLAAERCIPILFSSTSDVYGIVDGVASKETKLNPIGYYGKSKAEAETELKRICESESSPYTIFRFAPVYTETNKRDIQKRYYLKYPHIAYRIAKGSEYEVLSATNAANNVIEWIDEQLQGAYERPRIRNVKDDLMMNTANCIRQEQAEGRAKVLLVLSRSLVLVIYKLAKLLLGYNNTIVYLLNKVTNPLRTI